MTERVSRADDGRVRAVAAVTRYPRTEARDAGWEATLESFRGVLDEVERRLDANDWDEAVAALNDLPAAPPDEEPAPEQREAGRELLERAATLSEELRQAMANTREELDELSHRRVAAARYLAQTSRSDGES